MGDAATTRNLPPYVSFSTFWGVVQELHERGEAPQVLEPQILVGPGRGGGTVYELAHAFKSLGLIGEQRRVTPSGRRLIADPSPENLREVLEARYPEALALGLTTATSGQLNAVLIEMGMKDGTATMRKARTFFLQAAEKAGAVVGPHLRTRAAGTPARRQRPRSSQPANGNGAQTRQKADPKNDLLTRYVELLMDKVKEQDEPTTELLDRIERALGVDVQASGEAAPRVQPGDSTATS